MNKVNEIIFNLSCTVHSQIEQSIQYPIYKSIFNLDDNIRFHFK